MPDYGLILQRSWKIIKKHRWLLVYGLVLAGLSAGGSYQSLNINLPSGQFDLKNLPEITPEEIPEKMSRVLGAFTSGFAEWLVSVPLITWLLLIFGILTAFLVGIIIRLVITSWAKGGLITGIQLANQNQSVSLTNTSPSGIAAIKNLIILGLLIFGLGMAFFAITGIVFFVGFFIFKNIPVLNFFWPMIGGTVGFLAFFLAVILFAMISIYAERLIVLKGYSPWEAWKKGFSLSKKGFLPTLVMGIINSILSFSVGCLSTIILLIFLGIPAIVLIVPSIKSGKLFSPPTILGLLFILFVFLNVNLLVRAIIVIFKYGNWNQLFEEVLSREEAS